MNDSWLALADQQGLRLLVRETEHSLIFLIKRAERENAECFWAVLTARQADYIEYVRRAGDARWALKLLEYFATDIGRIGPAEVDVENFSQDVTFPEWRDKESLI